MARTMARRLDTYDYICLACRSRLAVCVLNLVRLLLRWLSSYHGTVTTVVGTVAFADVAADGVVGRTSHLCTQKCTMLHAISPQYYLDYYA